MYVLSTTLHANKGGRHFLEGGHGFVRSCVLDWCRLYIVCWMHLVETG